jgi:hypothetical protein
MGSDDLGFNTGVRIGTTVGNMETVKIQPHTDFNLGMTEDVVCGEKKEVGYPTVVWTYPDMELDGAQYYQLYKQTAGAASGSVVIRIPTREVALSAGTYDPVYATYNAVMRWPDEGITRGRYDRWVVESIEFTNLIAV